MAGRLGYGVEYVTTSFYVDNQRLGDDATLSNNTELNWQNRVFQFVGTGGTQTIRILSEATRVEANGRGMMIDDIVLTETLPSNSGFEDTSIAMPAIAAVLKDNDGSESLSLRLETLPVGSVLTDGLRSFTATTQTLLGFLAPYLAWCFSPLGAWLWLITVLPAMLLAAQHWPELTDNLSDQGSSATSITS